MRELDRRLTKLESGGQFMPDVQAMSDEDLTALLVASVEDWPRAQALIGEMSFEQLVRFEEALKQIATAEGAI